MFLHICVRDLGITLLLRIVVAKKCSQFVVLIPQLDHVQYEHVGEMYTSSKYGSRVIKETMPLNQDDFLQTEAAIVRYGRRYQHSLR